MAIVHLLVEGEIDEAIGRRLIAETGHTIGTCYGKHGYGYIKEKISGFNASAISMAYLALADFSDTGYPCPGHAIEKLLPYRKPQMLFRLVVREIESWILADRDGLADFLAVSPDHIPLDSDSEHDPKQTLVNIARRSRSSKIRSAIVPQENSTAVVGKLYNADLVRFVAESWNVGRACENSSSLAKCLHRLTELKRRPEDRQSYRVNFT
jgi:hypothetical protein